MTDHITIPRSWAQQAIEALEVAHDAAVEVLNRCRDDGGAYKEERVTCAESEVVLIAAAITSLRAALAQQQGEHPLAVRLRALADLRRLEGDDDEADLLDEVVQHLHGVAQQQQGEPVAWLIDWPDEPDLGTHLDYEPVPSELGRSTPLYTAPAAPAAAPAGWVLVPVEPTEEMIQAANDGDDAYTLRSFGPGVQRVMQGPEDHYAAMLAARPAAPAATREPLTDEQIAAAMTGYGPTGIKFGALRRVARAIERAHGIGEET